MVVSLAYTRVRPWILAPSAVPTVHLRVYFPKGTAVPAVRPRAAAAGTTSELPAGAFR
jgi:hypothetical protein